MLSCQSSPLRGNAPDAGLDGTLGAGGSESRAVPSVRIIRPEEGALLTYRCPIENPPLTLVFALENFELEGPPCTPAGHCGYAEISGGIPAQARARSGPQITVRVDLVTLGDQTIRVDLKNHDDSLVVDDAGRAVSDSVDFTIELEDGPCFVDAGTADGGEGSGEGGAGGAAGDDNAGAGGI
jgi:hypothetical protein